MGLWMRWSQAMAMMMSPLPRMAARKMPRKSQKCRSCSSRESANASRRKWVMELPLDVCFLYARGPVPRGIIN